MKKTILILAVYVFFISCEDVIEVELQPAEPKLVVNGLIRVDVEAQFIPIEIQVTESSGFFEDNQITQLESAVIVYGIPNPDAPEILENGGFSSLAELSPGTGIYIPDPTFDADQRISTQAAIPGMVFILIVEHRGRRYASRTTYAPTVPIDAIEQGTNTLFDEDDVELLVTITDAESVDNNYLFDFDFGEFLVLEDEFIDGQEFQFSYFYSREIEPGESAEVSILGADDGFFNYMDLLLEQTENDGGIFDTPAATVRGNVFDVTGFDNQSIFDNSTRPDDFALGYFAVVQEYKQNITFE